MARVSYPGLGALAAALGLLAACAQSPPAPPPPASPTAAIDGVYTGAANGSCGASQPARMELRAGRFTLSVASGLTLHGRAEENGTLSASEPGDDGREVNFTGQVDGPAMRGGSYNGRCAFAYALTRSS